MTTAFTKKPYEEFKGTQDEYNEIIQKESETSSKLHKIENELWALTQKAHISKTQKAFDAIASHREQLSAFQIKLQLEADYKENTPSSMGQNINILRTNNAQRKEELTTIAQALYGTNLDKDEKEKLMALFETLGIKPEKAPQRLTSKIARVFTLHK